MQSPFFHMDTHQLVLMDIQMPVMDGITATELILKEYPGTIILAITANITDENRQNCKKVGMKEFITKPIAKDQLETTLKRYGSLRNP